MEYVLEKMQMKYKKKETIIADVYMTFYTNKKISAL